MSCTSKCLWPRVRIAASRTAAKASGRMSSSVSPLASRSLNAGVRARSSSLDFALKASSRALISFTLEAIGRSFRSFAEPKNRCAIVLRPSIRFLVEMPLKGRQGGLLARTGRGGEIKTAPPLVKSGDSRQIPRPTGEAEDAKRAGKGGGSTQRSRHKRAFAVGADEPIGSSPDRRCKAGDGNRRDPLPEPHRRLLGGPRPWHAGGRRLHKVKDRFGAGRVVQATVGRWHRPRTRCQQRQRQCLYGQGRS